MLVFIFQEEMLVTNMLPLGWSPNGKFLHARENLMTQRYQLLPIPIMVMNNIL